MSAWQMRGTGAISAPTLPVPTFHEARPGSFDESAEPGTNTKD